jgi:hypothetical protein
LGSALKAYPLRQHPHVALSPGYGYGWLVICARIIESNIKE